MLQNLPITKGVNLSLATSESRVQDWAHSSDPSPQKTDRLADILEKVLTASLRPCVSVQASTKDLGVVSNPPRAASEHGW